MYVYRISYLSLWKLSVIDMRHRIFTFGCLLLAVSCPIINAAGQGRDASVGVQIAGFKDDKAGAVSYTFDDGLRNQYLIAAPLMARLQIPGTFFVIPGEVAASAQEAEAKKPGAWGGVTWDEVRELAAQGFEIGNHGYNHKNLVDLKDDPAALEHEIEHSADTIMNETSIFPVSFCYPYNSFNDRIESIVKKRHAVARTFQHGFSARDTTAESLNRWIDRIIGNKEWGVAMIHGLIDGFDPLRPDVFESHLTYAKEHEKDIWIDTFGNIGRYVIARDATAVGNVKTGSNTVSFTPYCKDGEMRYDVPLTFVVSTETEVIGVTAKQGKKSIPATISGDRILIQCTPDGGRVTVKWKKVTQQ